jgi:hypothetical protein
MNICIILLNFNWFDGPAFINFNWPDLKSTVLCPARSFLDEFGKSNLHVFG